MSQFTTMLRANIETTYRSLETTRQSGSQFEIDLLAARLMDLLDRASSNGVAVTGWLPPAENAVVRDADRAKVDS
jgi:hypothetical protein